MSIRAPSRRGGSRSRARRRTRSASPSRDRPAVPERRAEHAAAVQRQRRQQVEREQYEVDVAEPGDDPVDAVRQARHRGDAGRRATPSASETSGPAIAIRNSAPALGNIALELRDAAEEPERDPLDLDSFARRLERVTELVQEQRGEEEDARRRRPSRCTRRRRGPGFCAGNTAARATRRSGRRRSTSSS